MVTEASALLSAPIVKVCEPDTPSPFSPLLEKYAQCFSQYHISREQLKKAQSCIMMACRQSMRVDIVKSGVCDGFSSIHSGADTVTANINGHSRSLWGAPAFRLRFFMLVDTLQSPIFSALIKALDTQMVVPIHTMHPEAFHHLSDQMRCKVNGVPFEVWIRRIIADSALQSLRLTSCLPARRTGYSRRLTVATSSPTTRRRSSLEIKIHCCQYAVCR